MMKLPSCNIWPFCPKHYGYILIYKDTNVTNYLYIKFISFQFRSSMKYNIPCRTLRDWMKRLNIKSVFNYKGDYRKTVKDYSTNPNVPSNFCGLETNPNAQKQIPEKIDTINKPFKSQDTLVENVHASISKSDICDICGLAVKDAGALKKHVQVVHEIARDMLK